MIYHDHTLFYTNDSNHYPLSKGQNGENLYPFTDHIQARHLFTPLLPNTEDIFQFSDENSQTPYLFSDQYARHILTISDEISWDLYLFQNNI